MKSNKSYFEGWYFKNTKSDNGISFIPGISIDKNEKKAFIQVITKDSSYFVNYSINDFKYNFNPFYIKIENNTFSKDGIEINIKDTNQNLNITGKINYSNSKNINTKFYPNIMGPFSYIPFMECNHAILSMQNDISGKITINNNTLNFDKGTGYIEKDFGCSFPNSYIWCQGNNFKKNKNASFMLSIANIPFKIFKFKGVICDILINGKEYKFTTYNNVKLIESNINNNSFNITLKKGKYFLNITSTFDKGHKLSAPIKGKMQKNIFESISSKITITLKESNNIIFSDTSTNCGLEVVKE